MSFELLKTKIIDTNQCIGCGICAKSCKHIEMSETVNEKNKKTPLLKGKCIMTTIGLTCGNCYNSCPMVRRGKKKDPENFLNTREKVLKAIEEHPKSTIPKIADLLSLSTIKVRFEALRLVELNQVEFQILPNQRDPFFLKTT
ncbi:4Fe-4S binding protein [Candidatus Harpocratesius sp.]